MGTLVVMVMLLSFIIGAVTAAARYEDLGEATGSIAAGVLWPIYLPYRLALMIWKGEV